MQSVTLNPYFGKGLNDRSKKSNVVKGLMVDRQSPDSRKTTSQGLIISNGANGTRNITSKDEMRIRRANLISFAKRLGLFELIWYPFFIIAGLLCLIFVRPFDFELVFCVFNLYLYMFANNLVARGHRSGLIVSTLAMILYSVVSFLNGVWGEVIINVFMYIPLEVIGFIKWKSNTQDSASNGDLGVVRKFTITGILLCTLVCIGLSGGIWAILHFALKQNFAIWNAIAIGVCLVGDWARNNQYIETWFLFIIANLASIILWGCEAFIGDGSGTLTLSVLPLMLSFASTLTNDFNGWAIWATIYKKNHKPEGVYLAKRKVNIKKVARLKDRYRSYVCRETD